MYLYLGLGGMRGVSRLGGRSFEELLRCELREGVPILSTFDGSSCRG